MQQFHPGPGKWLLTEKDLLGELVLSQGCVCLVCLTQRLVPGSLRFLLSFLLELRLLRVMLTGAQQREPKLKDQMYRGQIHSVLKQAWVHAAVLHRGTTGTLSLL